MVMIEVLAKPGKPGCDKCGATGLASWYEGQSWMRGPCPCCSWWFQRLWYRLWNTWLDWRKAQRQRKAESITLAVRCEDREQEDDGRPLWLIKLIEPGETVEVTGWNRLGRTLHMVEFSVRNCRLPRRSIYVESIATIGPDQKQWEGLPQGGKRSKLDLWDLHEWNMQGTPLHPDHGVRVVLRRAR